ncbi:multicopper oxidase, partial [Bradyrhizobium sp. STM 3809]|uniref:multicopper oxidase n=1 Tax=Bradyrhizobium sp. STM 3809 TaxID=551936 RepID=UPI000558D4E6
MTQRWDGVSRRAVLGGFAAACATSWPRLAPAAERVSVALEGRTESLALAPGRPASRVLQLAGGAAVLRFGRGSSLDLALANGLAIPAALSGRGLALPTPLLIERPVAPGGRASIAAAASRAGTGLLDLRLLADGTTGPIRPLPVIVDEAVPVTFDRDEVFVVEDFRIKPDGTAIAPGTDAKDAELLYSVNGQLQPDIALRPHARVRLRFINGCHRAVIAIKIADVEAVRVIAIDSQPAEPFLARNGAVVLPPGGRTDVAIDMPAAKAPLQVFLHDGTAARPIARLTLSTEPPLREAPLPPAAP